MLNVSSDREGSGAAVLFRAIEPLEGIELMKRPPTLKRLLDLTRGPGRLATALRIDKRFDGMDSVCARAPLARNRGTPDRADGRKHSNRHYARSTPQMALL